MNEIVLAACGGGSAVSKGSANASGNTKNGNANNNSNIDDSGMMAFALKPAATSIGNFKNTATCRHGVIGLKNQRILSVDRGKKDAEKSKSVLRFWSWKKEHPVHTCSSPEKIGPLCATSCGSFVIGGGASGSAYIWKSSSGELVRVWKPHYIAVTCIRILQDDSFVITGGEDGMISVWNIGDLLDKSCSNVQQAMSLSDHTLPIQDIWCGGYGFNARILSCSKDHTLKLWFLHTGDSSKRPHLLESIVLPEAVACCTSDSLETFAFVGGVSGKIYECALRDGLGGGSLAPASSTLSNSSKKRKLITKSCRRILEGHSSEVTCLKMSTNGLILVSGSLDGSCRLWDTFSGQTVKVIKVQGGHRPVVSLVVCPMPAELARGHGISSMSSNSNSRKAQVLEPVKTLSRYQVSASDTSEVVRTNVRFYPRCRTSANPTTRTISSEMWNFVSDGKAEPIAHGSSSSLSSSSLPVMIPLNDPSSTAATGGVSNSRIESSRVEDLERENSRLKAANSKLYAIAVGKFLSKFPEV